MSSADQPAPARGYRATLAARRRERTQEILTATRRLFDERGLRDAQIEDIARAVGVNKAIIYRHFSGKEELFALVLEGYLGELSDRMAAAADANNSPTRQLEDITGCFFDFGSNHPAFVDCALALMRRSGPELLEEVSEDAMTRLGRSIGTCLGQVTRVLRAGNDEGVFAVDDPDVLANTLYAQGLGLLQLARVGLLVTERKGVEAPGEAAGVVPGVVPGEEAPGEAPGVATIPPEHLRQSMVASAVTLARGAGQAADDR